MSNKEQSEKPQYAHSFNDEDFTGRYDSRGDAMLDAFATDEEAEVCFTGLCVVPPRLPDANDLIEQVCVNTTEESGDWSEGYLSEIPKEAVDELQTELQGLWDRWEKKYGLEPTFYNVEDVLEHMRPNAPKPTPKLRDFGMNDNKIGEQEGEICNRDGCEGVMYLPEVENCSCHINPPCWGCVNNKVTCRSCGSEAN